MRILESRVYPKQKWKIDHFVIETNAAFCVQMSITSNLCGEVVGRCTKTLSFW